MYCESKIMARPLKPWSSLSLLLLSLIGDERINLVDAAFTTYMPAKTVTAFTSNARSRISVGTTRVTRAYVTSEDGDSIGEGSFGTGSLLGSGSGTDTQIDDDDASVLPSMAIPTDDPTDDIVVGNIDKLLNWQKALNPPSEKNTEQEDVLAERQPLVESNGGTSNETDDDASLQSLPSLEISRDDPVDDSDAENVASPSKTMLSWQEALNPPSETNTEQEDVLAERQPLAGRESPPIFSKRMPSGKTAVASPSETNIQQQEVLLEQQKQQLESKHNTEMARLKLTLGTVRQELENEMRRAEEIGLQEEEWKETMDQDMVDREKEWEGMQSSWIENYDALNKTLLEGNETQEQERQRLQSLVDDMIVQLNDARQYSLELEENSSKLKQQLEIEARENESKLLDVEQDLTSRFDNQTTLLQNKADAVQQQLNQSETQVQTLQALQSKMLDAEQDLTSRFDNQTTLLQNKADAFQQQLNQSQTQVQTLQALQSKMLDAEQDLTSRFDNQTTLLQNKADAFQQQLNQSQTQVQALQSKMLDTEQDLTSRFDNQTTLLQNKADAFQQQLNQSETQVQTLQALQSGEATTIQKEITSLEERLRRTAEQLKSAREYHGKLRNEINQMRNKALNQNSRSRKEASVAKIKYLEEMQFSAKKNAMLEEQLELERLVSLEKYQKEHNVTVQLNQDLEELRRVAKESLATLQSNAKAEIEGLGMEYRSKLNQTLQYTADLQNQLELSKQQIQRSKEQTELLQLSNTATDIATGDTDSLIAKYREDLRIVTMKLKHARRYHGVLRKEINSVKQKSQRDVRKVRVEYEAKLRAEREKVVAAKIGRKIELQQEDTSKDLEVERNQTADLRSVVDMLKKDLTQQLSLRKQSEKEKVRKNSVLEQDLENSRKELDAVKAEQAAEFNTLLESERSAMEEKLSMVESQARLDVEKLEQERDEARAVQNQAESNSEQLKQERDDARAVQNQAELNSEQLKQERDDAREELDFTKISAPPVFNPKSTPMSVVDTDLRAKQEISQIKKQAATDIALLRSELKQRWENTAELQRKENLEIVEDLTRTVEEQYVRIEKYQKDLESFREVSNKMGKLLRDKLSLKRAKDKLIGFLGGKKSARVQSISLDGEEM